MTLGKVMAEAGMESGFEVTWLPSYGAEVRGGTAHSMVRISSERIASPIVYKANTAIMMNSPSLDKFEDRIEKGGLLIINTSMTSRKSKRKDIDIIEAPLTDEAIVMGNVRVANMIALGIYAAKKGILKKEVLLNCVDKMTGGREELKEINTRAIEWGMKFVD